MHGWWLDYTNFRDLLSRTDLLKNLASPVGPFIVIHRSGTVDRLTFSRHPSPFNSLDMLGDSRA